MVEAFGSTSTPWASRAYSDATSTCSISMVITSHLKAIRHPLKSKKKLTNRQTDSLREREKKAQTKRKKEAKKIKNTKTMLQFCKFQHILLLAKVSHDVPERDLSRGRVCCRVKSCHLQGKRRGCLAQHPSQLPPSKNSHYFAAYAF